MTTIPQLIFLDTNVYLIGAVDLDSAEGQILQMLGWEFQGDYRCEVVISEELIDQISRVAKRLKNKDWGGEIIGRIWQKLKVRYIQIDDSALATIEAQGIIPREDVGVYLTAKQGQAQCFVSANHKLIRILAQQTGEFECLTPSEFVSKYLNF
ncbi:PIN domain-containing protein [Iningainema tapete]|uniref:PIN domain-containing protein n=1 Tax=Iningainema tapete BLCC-T55 TaxID=2748662 RepID=A0A8J6XWM5_9CYAN|nr:PIN domain-containing protein [Iningainema tapete]MBD2777757.1 PIN domain-containing protein [Iningainema tapete BLCC-T55]